ncbi:RNA-directed DNA polymerase from mobile element jockey-like 19 [Homarus americanus]|uniref:RNA-directed DNA polymerase from mobile element jockey-like 19 n=1 Tax=Homarus americanus TaxID=6706 RepID=A0A8J5MW64_HOMAM|nr:RNA-directed DNA polymerase from mobile element jockey-like 19 [Homarus americanus]
MIISDKKDLPFERSLKTMKPQALCNKSGGIEQHAQTVSKHDHRQKRQHPEERRKNSRDTPQNKRNSTSCSQETATIPNGRGGERLNHERREQLQHQRRRYIDKIAPPPCHIKITQWNVQGQSNKRHTVQAAAIAKNIDVFILQETLMSKDKQFRLPGYQQYSLPKGPNSHGSMILVRATIPSSEVEPVHCGDGVEAQAVRIHLANDSLVVYNIYKPPTKLLTQATQELVLIAGDFIADHPTINSTTRMNQDGHHLVELLTDVPEITLINTGEPTHILGGTLDFTFFSTELVPLLPPPPRSPPIWNTKKANWKLYQDELQKWYSNSEPAEDIDQLNQDLTDAIQYAEEKAIPKTNTTNRHHKDYWFNNDEVTESTDSEDICDSTLPLREAAVQHAHQITQKIMEDKWLEWCATFNAHISLSELWKKLRIATGKLPKARAHPQPLQEANRLAEHFAERSSSAQLPPEIRLLLQQIEQRREVVKKSEGPRKQAKTLLLAVMTNITNRMHRQNRPKGGPYTNPLENWTTSPQYLWIHQRARESDIKNGLLLALNLNRDVFNKKTWLLCAADAVNRLKLKDNPQQRT